MITYPNVRKQVVRSHYNLSTPFYRILWGPHIHHGLWDADEPPRAAQLQLTERLANLAGVSARHTLVDIGCGMGASSIHLVKTRQCRAVGVTLSPLQRHWAAMAAGWHGVGADTKFYCADAEDIEFPAESFDVIWSIECTEHFFNKPQFFARAAQWLKPGGAIAICAWLAGDTTDADRTRQVEDVCEGFFCPSLGTSHDYVQWMERADLHVDDWFDWTDRVARTWEICRERVRRSRVRWLARIINHDSVMFLDRFKTILAAYESGAMRYGCFIAHKTPAV
jgi:tocopherol O-methyltransferase